MDDLLEARDGALVTLTMNRPDAMNALSEAMMRSLLDALERLGADPEVGAIVLTGAGRGFCSGGDVKGMASKRERELEERIQELRWKQRIPLAMRTCPKVIVAAINGAAMGAGLSLALAADFRVVARSAKFATAFATVGYSGDFGVSWTLTQIVGTAKARELMILNPRLSAEEAQALGLVTRLVDDDKLVQEAAAFAREISEGPRVAWGYMKRNLFAAESESFAALLEVEAQSQSRCALTADHREARSAWAEKRKPMFHGA